MGFFLKAVEGEQTAPLGKVAGEGFDQMWKGWFQAKLTSQDFCLKEAMQ